MRVIDSSTIRIHDIRSSNHTGMKEHVTESVTLVIGENSGNFPLMSSRTMFSISDAVPCNYMLGVDQYKEDRHSEDYEEPSVTPAMYSTKLYINNDIREIAAFRKRYSEKEGFDPENHSIVQFTSVKKEVTVEDFFRGGVKTMVGHIRDSDSSFHCIVYAKIHKIHRENGWTYLACNRCGRSTKEVDDDQSSSSGKRAKKQKNWHCRVHKALTSSGVGMRFKVIVRVIDATGSASLLLFDDLVFKLSGEQCVHLIRQHGENYDDYFLEELNVLVGKSVVYAR
ncbi:replication protein A 70 kDa DNA-binding subunit B [Tanacetum coccineum]